MKRSEIAKTIMTGREAARRSNCRFLLRPDAARIAGLSAKEFGDVMRTVYAVESFADSAFTALDSGSGLYICTSHGSSTNEPARPVGCTVSPLTQVLEFLNSLEGAGYGGMASFEIARMTISEEVEALTSPLPSKDGA